MGSRSLTSFTAALTILALPMVEAAPLPLKVVCFGVEAETNIRIDIYTDHPKNTDINVVINEYAPMYNRVLLIKKSDLAVVSEKPVILKSRTASPEFYVDMTPRGAEFQGYYNINNVQTDTNIPLKCRAR